MGPFRLSKSLITGHPKVDAEHEQLRKLLNEFILLHDSGDYIGCAEKIRVITKTVKNHFASEERVMEGVGYLNLASHKAEHQSTIVKYEALIADTEEVGYGPDFVNELTAVLVNDMIRADIDFKEFLETQTALA
ncbi:MAG: hypothetical protein OQK35_06775 [Alphaproteobacteria bacterium]|nr:hypothetical protein [Rhodospirillales bacterium]MCW9046021.1 hypothetical protein [Alphaproteobacteria bacterium]